MEINGGKFAWMVKIGEKGQFVNCKIYGDTTSGEVYTTWLYDNLPIIKRN